MHTLLLYLCGPMQSWGYRSRFDDRDTGLEPTRSGIIGLICSAMGIGRSESLDRFNKLRIGVRIDKQGKPKVDYHTAKDVIKADGSKPGTVISHRHYLSDAAFLVGLESDDIELLKDIEQSFLHPVWSLYLGRKSFPLSLPPLLPGMSIKESCSLEDALCNAPYFKLKDTEKELPDGLHLRLVIEPKAGEVGEYSRGDNPINYDNRIFGLRTVSTSWVDSSKLTIGGVLPCISQE